MAKKGGNGNNKKPIKNANMIGAGEKKTINELKKAPNENIKKPNETFVQKEDRTPKSLKDNYLKDIIKSRHQNQQNQKSKEPEKDK